MIGWKRSFLLIPDKKLSEDNGKTKELDVDKKTFDSMEDGMEGMLDYKGCMFYYFEADK